MNYLEIIELVKRLENIEETLTYWKTPSFTSSIENTLHNIKRLEQEREDVQFQLEFPYQLIELLTKVEDIEGARVQVYKRQKDNITAISVDYNGVYHYIRIDEDNRECFEELAKFITECKEQEVCQNEQDIQTALSKLTDIEKKLLGITL